MLFLEVNEYLKGLTTGYGARVHVHEPGTYPYPAEEGLYIPASMETDIGLRMVWHIINTRDSHLEFAFHC